MRYDMDLNREKTSADQLRLKLRDIKTCLMISNCMSLLEIAVNFSTKSLTLKWQKTKKECH